MAHWHAFLNKSSIERCCTLYRAVCRDQGGLPLNLMAEVGQQVKVDWETTNTYIFSDGQTKRICQSSGLQYLPDQWIRLVTGLFNEIRTLLLRCSVNGSFLLIHLIHEVTVTSVQHFY